MPRAVKGYHYINWPHCFCFAMREPNCKLLTWPQETGKLGAAWSGLKSSHSRESVGRSEEGGADEDTRLSWEIQEKISRLRENNQSFCGNSSLHGCSSTCVLHQKSLASAKCAFCQPAVVGPGRCVHTGVLPEASHCPAGFTASEKPLGRSPDKITQACFSPNPEDIKTQKPLQSMLDDVNKQVGLAILSNRLNPLKSFHLQPKAEICSNIYFNSIFWNMSKDKTEETCPLQQILPLYVFNCITNDTTGSRARSAHQGTF